MANVPKNVSALINTAGSAAIVVAGMLLGGCTHNITVRSQPNFSNTQTEKIKTRTLLIISDSLSNYVYKGTGSIPEVSGLSWLDTWIFPLGQPTSDLLRKGVPLIFEEVEVAAESPPSNDLKGPAYGLILKPSIESFDFGSGPPSWVKIKYKMEVRDSNGKMVFQETATGRGESKAGRFDIGGKTSLAKAADDAVQSGVKLLLDSLSRMSFVAQGGAEAPR